jgi:hypothetical protein
MSNSKRNTLPLKIAIPPRTDAAERQFLGLVEPAEGKLGRRWRDSRLRRDITGTERLQVYVPPLVAERLRLCGVKERRNQSDIVTAALERYLADKQL